MLKNIIFDVGYVLIDYTWEQKFAQFGYSKEDIKRLATVLFGVGVTRETENVWEDYDNGLVSSEEIKKICLERYPEDSKALDWFFSNPSAWAVLMNDMADMLPVMKEKGYKVYLLSNYPDDLWQAHVAIQPFHKYVDGEAVSYAEHIGKPDEKIYRALLDRFSLKPEECLFLDDRSDNTQTAESLGIHTVTLDSPEKRQAAIQMLRELPEINKK